jgi:hypothetical protein
VAGRKNKKGRRGSKWQVGRVKEREEEGTSREKG